MKDIEFFLADDIIQGEDVPFYLLWKGDTPKSIEIVPERFKDLIEIHNGVESEINVGDGKTVFREFHVPGYLGGVLSTDITDQPFVHASLNVKIISEDGETILLTEKRELYTTRIDLAKLPKEIFYNESGLHRNISINLMGITTVVLSIEELEDNKALFDIPDDIKEAIEKFSNALIQGFEKLRVQFPNHFEAIDYLLNTSTETTITEYVERIEETFKESFSRDKAFLEAVVTVLFTALSGQASIRDRILRPLMEYFESNAAEGVFLENPFMHIRIPREGCIMAVKISGSNILGQECTKPLEIRVKVRATDESLIPLKDIFSIRRSK
jgi:hypothetical protein